ncbi:hypothetical protein GCM10027290_44240 [Micromonospora sonneratiae]|uniref:Nuclear transport factor 2 family protein n=1 Tax=Micromonospora sonneratiae TaxID=1184706 RepID=A0ABW3Y8H8_9ACTN
MNTVDWSTGTRIPLADLPDLITAYLAEHQKRDTGTAIAGYAANAVVTDDGRTCRGRNEIRAWLDGAAASTTTRPNPSPPPGVDDGHFEVVQHLEGNFPGGRVDLRYRFTLTGPLIQELTISP